MTLERDLRFSLAPLYQRGVYERLFAARREIAAVLALGYEPAAIAARVLGVDRTEAESELAKLRAVGLVGDGLTLLVGARSSRARASTAPTAGEAPSADVEVVREALRVYGGSRRALARDLGCSESALRQFAAGNSSLSRERVESLAAQLGVRSTQCAVEVRSAQCEVDPRTTHLTAHPATAQVTAQPTAQPVSLSDSPSSLSVSSVSSEILSKESEASEANGESLREGTAQQVRSDDCAATQLTAQPTAQPETNTTPKRRAQRRAARTPAVDPVPPDGTVARRVYEAITTDVALGPRVTGPGDLSMRLAAICDGTSVDPAREVIALGAWLLRQPEGRWKDAAAGLLRNISNKVNEARALPVAAPGIARAEAPGAAKIDYQGRRVVGPAGLPPGSAWDKTKEEHEAEEDALYRRAYEATQPKTGGSNGR